MSTVNHYNLFIFEKVIVTYKSNLLHHQLTDLDIQNFTKVDYRSAKVINLTIISICYLIQKLNHIW